MQVNFTLSNDGGLFEVSPSGEVTLAGELDRETQAEYNITVTVTDRCAPTITACSTPLVPLSTEASHKEQLRRISWSVWKM